ncbi:MAG: magnesium chelatase, partial [Calditrichia bacterium]|nr:magnesium chelatase [Calditrichia bacterium]
PFKELNSDTAGESSEEIRMRVKKSRKIQQERFADASHLFCNANMQSREIRKYCKIDEFANNRLKVAMEKLGLSARAYDRILKVARTIADLENCDDIKKEHISEAIQYRSLDRNIWGN